MVGSSTGGQVGPNPGNGGPVVADGVWLMLEALPVGTHVITFDATSVFGVMKVTYTITVVPR